MTGIRFRPLLAKSLTYGSPAMLVPLLGLAGEVGELLSEYKKRLRDEHSYGLFRDRIAEELGDLLWYLSNVATKFGVSLEQVAQSNLEKIEARWASLEARPFLDEGFPPGEQLPRDLTVEFRLEGDRTIITVDGVQHGDALTDNRIEPDGYRFARRIPPRAHGCPGLVTRAACSPEEKAQEQSDYR